MLHQYQASPALNLSGFQEQMERRNNWKQPSPPGITDSHTILCLWASDQGIKRVEENWQWHLALVYFHTLFAPVVAQDRRSLFAEISTLRTIGRERDNLQDQTCHPDSAEPFACSLCLLIWQVNSKWKLPVYLISHSYFLLAHFVWVFLAGNNWWKEKTFILTFCLKLWFDYLYSSACVHLLEISWLATIQKGKR